MKLGIVEGIRSLGTIDTHQSEIQRICRDISICLRARRFVEGGNGEFRITVTDGSKKNSAVATVTDNGQTIYISLLQLMGEVATQKTKTYTFNSDNTRIFVHSAHSVNFGSLRWCLKEFHRGVISSLHGGYGRTFAQLLEEEFYLKLNSDISNIKASDPVEVLRTSIRLFLSDRDVFCLSPRLRSLLEPDIDPKEHLFQAALCISSGQERQERALRERSSILPIEKLKLASGSLYRRLLQVDRLCVKGGRKGGIHINFRGTEVSISVNAVRTDANCITLRPELTFQFPDNTIRLTWYTPNKFSVEKLTTESDWRNLFLASDRETHLSANETKKLTRRLELIDSCLLKVNWAKEIAQLRELGEEHLNNELDEAG